jgi:hypothetical protein
MPYYIFQNPQTGEVDDHVFFHMNDEKKYVVDGVEWKRLYTVPNASIDTKVDPYSSKDFATATANKKGQTLGQMWERSAEMSAQRAAKDGIDPVKKKFYDDYKKRTGEKHPHQKIEDRKAKAKEVTKTILGKIP